MLAEDYGLAFRSFLNGSDGVSRLERPNLSILISRDENTGAGPGQDPLGSPSEASSAGKDGLCSTRANWWRAPGAGSVRHSDGRSS